MIITILSILLLAIPAVIYLFVSIVVPIFPMHRSFKHAKSGIAIQVISDGIHADLVLPITAGSVDWWTHLNRKDYQNGKETTNLGFGWGDKGFYLEIPEWSDLTLKVAARAMLIPTSTAMHITAYHGPPPPRRYHHQILLTLEQYHSLVDFILAYFKKDSNGSLLLMSGAGYTETDNFYEAEGSYHAFRTCNTWTNHALAAAGVRTPLWTSSAQGIHWHLGRIVQEEDGF